MSTSASPATPLPALLAMADLMRETGLKKTSLTEKIVSGEIKSVKITRKARRVPREWFLEWVEQQKANARSPI